MSNVHLWVHVVWGTHDRRPLLQQPFRQKMISHIQENCQLKAIPLKAINGYLDQEIHHRGKSWVEELKEFFGDTAYVKG